MGSISFLLPDPLPPAAQATLRSACFATGYDMAPTPGTITVQDRILTISRNISESGYLLVPWPIGPFAAVVSATTTLRESDQPYRLLVELARGKLNQVRVQTAEWEGIGLRLPKGFQESLNEVTTEFARALLGPESSESDLLAMSVLERGYLLGELLAREFVGQMFDTRHHEEGLLDTRLAARTIRGSDAPAGEYNRSFNAAQVGFRWKDIEQQQSHYDWTDPDRAVSEARAAELPISAGPVIDLAADTIPEWALKWRNDLPTLAAFMCDFLETVINRYKGDIRRWVICRGSIT